MAGSARAPEQESQSPAQRAHKGSGGATVDPGACGWRVACMPQAPRIRCGPRRLRTSARVDLVHARHRGSARARAEERWTFCRASCMHVPTATRVGVLRATPHPQSTAAACNLHTTGPLSRAFLVPVTIPRRATSRE